LPFANILLIKLNKISRTLLQKLKILNANRVIKMADNAQKLAIFLILNFIFAMMTFPLHNLTKRRKLFLNDIKSLPCGNKCA